MEQADWFQRFLIRPAPLIFRHTFPPWRNCRLARFLDSVSLSLGGLMSSDPRARPKGQVDFELGEPRPAQRDKSILRIDLSGERRSGARPSVTRGRDGGEAR